MIRVKQTNQPTNQPTNLSTGSPQARHLNNYKSRRPVEWRLGRDRSQIVIMTY